MDHKQHHHTYIEEQVKSEALDKDLIKRLLTYLRPYRIILVIAIAFLILSKLIEASIPIFIGRISQQILSHTEESSGVFQKILREALLIIALLFLSYLLDSANVVLKNWIGQKGLYRLRTQVYEHVIQMPLSYYDKHTVGRLMTRTIHDIDQINQMFSESVIPIIGNIFLFVGIFVGIVYLDWRVAGLVLLLFPLVWWMTYRFRYFQRRCYDRIRTVVAAMNTFVQEHLMGASTIRNFGLQAPSRNRFEKINEDHCDAYLESIHHFAFFIAGIDLLQNLSLILAFVLIVAFAPPNHPFEAGTYFTFSLYALMFFRPLADLAERYNVLQSAMAAAARIFHLLDAPSERKVDLGSEELGEIKTIVFENVWFAYEPEQWILKGISFSLKQGISTAFVGMTGEGKSTIMGLILRFYPYQKGKILINDKEIGCYTLESLRRHFSVVLQDPVIFSGTIAENIALFSSSISHEDMKEVVDYMGMGFFIKRFEKGLHHWLGERGKGLSMGEMQLISMARAVAHQRPILILDEATANIDSLTEKIIQQAMQKILNATTAFVIAHRLSTIKDISQIYVLKDGVIIESGTHEELLTKKGAYEKLYRLQFINLS